MLAAQVHQSDAQNVQRGYQDSALEPFIRASCIKAKRSETEKGTRQNQQSRRGFLKTTTSTHEPDKENDRTIIRATGYNKRGAASSLLNSGDKPLTSKALVPQHTYLIQRFVIKSQCTIVFVHSAKLLITPDYVVEDSRRIIRAL
jgi:hypothetical protein